MATQDKRGSEKLLDAWKSRALTEDAVHEIANALEQSPARVERADATGVRLSLRYDGDDLPSCGNDILFWLP